MKRNGNAEGANGGGGLGRGYPPPQYGRGRNFILIFLSGNGALWCILGDCFKISIRRVKLVVKQFCVPTANWSVISHGGRIIHDIIHINTCIRVSSQPVRQDTHAAYRLIMDIVDIHVHATVYLYILLSCILFQ